MGPRSPHEEGRRAVDGCGGTGGGAVDGCWGRGGGAVDGFGGTAEGAVEGCEVPAGKGREATASCWWPDAVPPPICDVPPPGVSKMPSVSKSQSSCTCASN